jgi:hypothetical protein
MKNRTLNCEDDARDLSIILTDKILNKFEKYGRVSIPLEENYSFKLQDLITKIICKEYKIEKED